MTDSAFGLAVVDPSRRSVIRAEIRSRMVELGLSLLEHGAGQLPDLGFGDDDPLPPGDIVWMSLPDADLLLDLLEFAPEADTAWPKNGVERLQILVRALLAIVMTDGVVELRFVLNDGFDVEAVTRVSAADLWERVYADSLIYAPPNKLYIVRP